MSTETAPQQHAFMIDGDRLVTFIINAADRPVKPIKITFRGRQGWSKDIGRHRKAVDGEVTSRRFWLGHDQVRATWLASTICEYHEDFVCEDGEGLWNADVSNTNSPNFRSGPPSGPTRTPGRASAGNGDAGEVRRQTERVHHRASEEHFVRRNHRLHRHTRRQAGFGGPPLAGATGA